MPRYDYVCKICGETGEYKVPIEMPPGTDVICHNDHVMVRKFSPPAIVFKGSGFYSTSSRKVTS